jgi:hypothetical protein
MRLRHRGRDQSPASVRRPGERKTMRDRPAFFDPERLRTPTE